MHDAFIMGVLAHNVLNLLRHFRQSVVDATEAHTTVTLLPFFYIYPAVLHRKLTWHGQTNGFITVDSQGLKEWIEGKDGR